VRKKKLIDALVAAKANAVFYNRNEETDWIRNILNGKTDWIRNILPHYDYAFLFDTSFPYDTLDCKPPVYHHNSFVRLNALSVDENKVRHGFLQFFVAILKNYRKFLVYATKERPNPRSVFRNEDFLREHPEDWQPFISKVIKSRAFSHFVHERMGSALYGVVRDSNYSDIIFFEESIDSKMRSSLDTPLLSHTSDNYIKFFVPSPPDSDGLQSSSYSYK
jgi:hypothetical protein